MVTLKNIKFRVKENEFEDKMYAFGYKLSEHESAEITNEIEDVKYSIFSKITL